MRNHYMKSKMLPNSSFASATESVLYMLLELDELVVEKAWFDRYSMYCQQKPQEAKEMASNQNHLRGCIKLLIEKGYIKTIPGEALERVSNHF